MMKDTLTRQTAERLIEAATAAPSVHNSQPWRFVARSADRVIEIYADPARTLRRGDPRGRAVHIACGSALFNLRLAIAQAGCEPVARLLPSPRDPLLLASVRLAGPYRPRQAERDLYAAIRLIGRRPLAGHPPRGVLLALKEAAALEGASLRESGQVDALRMLAVISTSADDRVSWLRAGHAAQHVLRLATHYDVQAALLSLALEAPGASAQEETVLDGEHPAVILQFGSGHQRLATARRPVAQVLRVLSAGRVQQAAAPGRHKVNASR